MQRTNKAQAVRSCAISFDKKKEFFYAYRKIFFEGSAVGSFYQG